MDVSVIYVFILSRLDKEIILTLYDRFTKDKLMMI
jgi:hypothetical protein